MTPTPTQSPPQPPLQFQAYRPPLGDTTTSVINSQPMRKRKAANKSSNTANKQQRQTTHTTATEPAPAISESRESTPEVSPFQPSVYGVGPAILPTIIPPPPPVQIYGSILTQGRPKESKQHASDCWYFVRPLHGKAKPECLPEKEELIKEKPGNEYSHVGCRLCP